MLYQVNKLVLSSMLRAGNNFFQQAVSQRNRSSALKNLIYVNGTSHRCRTPTGSSHTTILLSQQHPEPYSTVWYEMHFLLLVMFSILRAKLNLQHSCKLFTNIASLCLNISRNSAFPLVINIICLK